MILDPTRVFTEALNATASRRDVYTRLVERIEAGELEFTAADLGEIIRALRPAPARRRTGHLEWLLQFVATDRPRLNVVHYDRVRRRLEATDVAALMWITDMDDRYGEYTGPDFQPVYSDDYLDTQYLIDKFQPPQDELTEVTIADLPVVQATGGPLTMVAGSYVKQSYVDQFRAGDTMMLCGRRTTEKWTPIYLQRKAVPNHHGLVMPVI